jgi:hypothetical protein
MSRFSRENGGALKSHNHMGLSRPFKGISLFITTFRITQSLKLTLISMASLKLILSSPILGTRVDSIFPLVGSLKQADTIYFDLNSAFDFIQHAIVPHKVGAFRLRDKGSIRFIST